MESFLANYTTSTGETFSVYTCDQLEPRTGMNVGLFFRVIPAKDSQSYWWCVIRISTTLLKVWDVNNEGVRTVLTKLGLLKVRQALEIKNNTTFDFMFSTYNSESTYGATMERLAKELEKFKKREPIGSKKSNGVVPSVKTRRDLRKKVLQLHYDLSDANYYNFVERIKIGKHLDMDPNDKALLGVYHYLEEKGFLKVQNNVEDSITNMGIDEVEEGYPILIRQDPLPFVDPSLQIFVDNIHTFSKVRNIKSDEISYLIPLKLSEDKIQQSLEDIIGEPFHKRDWGGEKNDLFTTYLQTQSGHRTPTAFLLKGSGTKGKLTLKKCGKNGDQVVRLFESPAELFVIQHVDEISEEVQKDALGKTKLLRHEGKNASLCLINGTDTVRILKAYKVFG